jgi:hypothetical protein
MSIVNRSESRVELQLSVDGESLSCNVGKLDRATAGPSSVASERPGSEPAMLALPGSSADGDEDDVSELHFAPHAQAKKEHAKKSDQGVLISRFGSSMRSRVARILDATASDSGGDMPANPYQAPRADLDDDAPRASGEEIEGMSELLAPLKGTQPWVKLASIAGFIGAGLLMLIGVLALVVEMKVPTILALVYVMIGVVYIAPAMHLWRYAATIQASLRDRETRTVVRALEHQQKFWHFVGMITLLVFALYAIGFAVILFTVLSKPHL